MAHKTLFYTIHHVFLAFLAGSDIQLYVFKFSFVVISLKQPQKPTTKLNSTTSHLCSPPHISSAAPRLTLGIAVSSQQAWQSRL